MVQVPESGRTNLVGMKVDFEIKGRGGDPIVRKGKEITRTSLEGLRKANIGEVEIERQQFEGAYAVADVVNTETGEVILEANNEITADEASGNNRERRARASQSSSRNAMTWAW